MRTLNRTDTDTEKPWGFYQRFLKGGKPARCGEQVPAVFAWMSAASSSGKRLAGRATATLYVVSRAKRHTTIKTNLSAGWVGYDFGCRRHPHRQEVSEYVTLFLMYQGKRRSRKSGAPVLMAAGGCRHYRLQRFLLIFAGLLWCLPWIFPKEKPRQTAEQRQRKEAKRTVA